MRRTLTILFLVVCLPAMLFAAVGMKTDTPPPISPDTSAPDAWGYTWVRSNQPGGPAFNWVDITTRGTQVNGLGDDNSVGPFSLGFAFPYYWYEATSFRVGSNGYITFGNQTANFASPFAQLPNTTDPDDMLAILVGDLDFTVAAANPRCYYWTNGVDSLVVSFISVAEWRVTTNPNTRHTFQVILNKQDSSIVFQYGTQQGRFNDTNNNTLCIGMENQTGQIGLNYVFSTTPPHALLPDSGIAIRLKRTVNTGLSVIDAGIVGGFNQENLAKIVRATQADTIKAFVRNFGTQDLASVRVTYQIARAGQPTVRDTVFIVPFNAGESRTVVFPRLFTPAVTGSYTATFTTQVAGDVTPSNNSKVAELLSVNLNPANRTPLAFEGGTVGGNINWSGGGGMAADFEVPATRVRLESVYVSIAAVTANPMIVEILDGSTGSPGTLLGTRSVNAIAGMNGVSFVSDSIRIPGSHFFVSARGQMAFNYESTPPISYRTWEYTNGYAPYRSRDVSDVIIRAVVREETVPVVPTDSSWVEFTAAPPPGFMVSMTAYDDSGNARSLYFGYAENMNACIVPTDTYLGHTEVELPPMPPTGVFDARLRDPRLTTGPCFGEGSLVDFRPAVGPGQRDTFYVVFQEGTGGRPVRLRWPSGLGATMASMNLVDPITMGLLFNINMLAETTYAVPAPYTGAMVLGQRGASAAVGLLPSTVNGLLYADGCDSVRVTALAFTWDTTTYNVPNLDWMAPENQQVGAGFPLPPGAPEFPHDAHITYVYYPGGQTPQVLNIDTLIAGRRYRLLTDCGAVGVGVTPEIPERYSLSQNYPNPFNPSTKIVYSLPVQSEVSMVIYDILGREVRRIASGETRPAGTYEVTWDGTNNQGLQVPTGAYFLRFEAGHFTDMKKLLLLK